MDDAILPHLSTGGGGIRLTIKGPQLYLCINLKCCCCCCCVRREREVNDDDRSLPADNNHQLELHEENKRPRDSPVDNMIPIARCTEIPFSRFLPEKNADYLDIFVTTQYPPPLLLTCFKMAADR